MVLFGFWLRPRIKTHLWDNQRHVNTTGFYIRVTVNPTSIPSLGTVGLLYFLQLVVEKWLWSNFVFPWLMRLNIFHVYSPLKFPLLWMPGCLFLIFPFFTQSTQIYCTVCASSFSLIFSLYISLALFRNKVFIRPL